MKTVVLVSLLALVAVIMAGSIPCMAALDDVSVYPSILSQAQIEGKLRGESGSLYPNAALDDVSVYSGALSKAQIDSSLIGGGGSLYPKAAIDDVIVWNTAKTQAQIEDTLVNGYSSTTGMMVWWKFDDSNDLIYDEISQGSLGVIKGAPISKATATPFNANGRAATGFSSKNDWLVAAIPGTNHAYGSYTFEMWVRNPQLNGNAVIMSISSNEAGGGDQDNKRLWVNPDGSLSIADRGFYTGWPTYTSDPLEWDPDKWYQITVTTKYIGTVEDRGQFIIEVKVYRGEAGGTTVQKALEYDSSTPVGGNWFLSVGGHTDGLAGIFPGGFFGPDPAPEKKMYWSFDDSDDLIYDEVSGDSLGVIKGAPISVETATPFDANGRAATGFVSKDDWIVAPIPGTNHKYGAYTFQTWVRNPQLNGNAVIMSISSNEAGGGDQDNKRLWVNPDGSLSMADRGYYTGWPTYTSDPLEWDPDKWYQITVTTNYIGTIEGRGDFLIEVKVYRGVEGGTTVAKLLEYDSSTPVGGDWFLSVGGHTDGLAGIFPGGFLGPDPAPEKVIYWSFDDPNDLVYDEVSGDSYGVIKGSPTSIATATPFDANGRAASGFVSKDDWLVAPIPGTNHAWGSYTYEMWVRNPQFNGNAVIMSLSGTEEGGSTADNKRLWVNSDGSLTMQDRGFYTGWPSYTTDPLEWEPDKWYQITVTTNYIGTIEGRGDFLIEVKVYRGVAGESTVTKIIEYDSSVPVSATWHISVGGHTDGLGIFPGGFLGDDVWSNPIPAKPKLHPAGASMTEPILVTITCVTPGVVIRYTTDGSDPTETSAVYTGPITATDNMTITARSFKDGIASNPASAYFYIPDPLTIDYSTSIVVDGNLNEWSESDFVDIDRLYWIPDDYPAYPISIVSAKYAAKWNENKLYVAVKVNDPTSGRADDYNDGDYSSIYAWMSQDYVDVYLRAPGSSGPSAYGALQEAAQHYSVGIKNSNPTDSWAVLGGHTALPESIGMTRAVQASGNWLYYEFAFTPWLYFGGLKDPVETSVPCTLKTGDYIGLDVTVFDMLEDYYYAGMLGENEVGGKSGDYNNIVLHQLVGGVSYTPMSLVDAKKADDGTKAELNAGSVTKAFDDFFYVGTADRASGIRVDKTGNNLSEGAIITKLTGEVKTDAATGEKYIDAADVVTSGTQVIAAVGGSNAALAGVGLETVGLLVKTWGRVTSLGGGYYKIDDGSALDVRFQVVSGTFTVDTAKTYAVTGPMSLYKTQEGPVVALVIVKDAAADIQAF